MWWDAIFVLVVAVFLFAAGIGVGSIGALWLMDAAMADDEDDHHPRCDCMRCMDSAARSAHPE